PTSRAMVTVPVAGKPTRLDITDEIRAACESLVPPVSETMLELVSRVEPEFQEKVRHHITLAGGGSQIFGLGEALVPELCEVGGDVRVRAHVPVRGPGGDGAHHRTCGQHGCPRPGCETDHRSAGRGAQPDRRPVLWHRAAPGVGLHVLAAVRIVVTR